MHNPIIISSYEKLPSVLKKYRPMEKVGGQNPRKTAGQKPGGNHSKTSNKTIVLTQGTFDMIHIGHARYLEKAKEYGDVLFVGVDSDEKVKERKGPDRPVVPESERIEMLTHLTSVDHVVLKPAVTPKWQLIKLIKPDVLIATAETYSPAEITELEKICGKVVVLEPMATTSTSAKIRRVQIGAAKKMSKTLSNKLIKAIEDALEELK